MNVYKKSFKEEAVKLAIEIGTNKAAYQLGVSKSTLSTWRSNKEKEHS
jgi:transposase-like protein